MSIRESRETYARLVTLRDAAGASLHERLKLADQLLSDREWVDDMSGGGGDESRAIDRLEHNCFGDVAMPLPDMLDVLRAVPQLSVWKQNKFNLRRMSEEMRSRQDASRRASRTAGATATSGASPSATDGGQPATRSPADEVRRLKEELRSRDHTIAQLTRENRRLKRAIQKLREAIADLQPV